MIWWPAWDKECWAQVGPAEHHVAARMKWG